MSIWKLLLKDEEYFGTDIRLIGLAKTAKEAIEKVFKVAKKEHPDCKHLYISELECLGSKDF